MVVASQKENVVNAGPVTQPSAQKQGLQSQLSSKTVFINPTSGQRFEKGEQIGKGGFSRVYETFDTAANEPCAIKVINKTILQKPKARAKLRSEIKIHASMRHKHIVGFREYFEDEENVYIVLELCKHQTLMERVKAEGRMSEEDTRLLILQLLESLEYMHANLVIHRDLKLGNIFLSERFSVKVGDFGLAARLEHDEERKKTMCGTPNYIAPEILDTKRGHSFEVDIWAVGVILYTMLVGKPPFETSDIQQTYRLIRSGTYSYPPHIRLAPEAEDLINILLTPNPALRPTLKEVLASPFLTGKPRAESSVRPVKPTPNAMPSGVRTPRALAPPAPRVPVQNCPVHVVHFLDYTSKYGLGYLLSNGAIGAYFNDATKMLLSPDEKDIKYVPRSHSEATVEYPATDVPSDLAKKTKLIFYFANYFNGEKQKLELVQPKGREWQDDVVSRWTNSEQGLIAFRFGSTVLQVKRLKANTDTLMYIGEERQEEPALCIDRVHHVTSCMLSDLPPAELDGVKACWKALTR